MTAGDARKAQIVSAAIDRLYAVGFEGLRIGDVARDVGINNATLIHHFPSKVALIKAVVERFTQRFEAVAEAPNTAGGPRAMLARHMQASVALRRAVPEMFAVLNEIMVRARRDAEMARLVSVPLLAWRAHIVALIAAPEHNGGDHRRRAEAIATVCMAQLLGMGLLLSATGEAEPALAPTSEAVAGQAIAAVTGLLEESP